MADLSPERREELTRALHRHTCGTDWDEWNQPCAWAGDDWDYDNGPNTCAYVGEVGVEDAIAPLLAAEHAAGAAEVRARVEAVLSQFTHDGTCRFAQGYDVPCDCWLSDVAVDLRAALNGGE